MFMEDRLLRRALLKARPLERKFVMIPKAAPCSLKSGWRIL